MALKWQRKSLEFHQEHGRKRRVFCASLADVFDNQWEDVWRSDLWGLIKDCPDLDFLMLTKRPQNIRKMLPADWGNYGWPNVWLGSTTENQEEADRRIPHLLAVPAKVHFLSCEPLLGPINFSKVPGFNRVGLDLSSWWAIVGGESGARRRPMDLDWARSIRDQCRIAGVSFFGKQYDKIIPLPDDLMVRQFPGRPT